ncbi:MAG: 2OG-Fe(II) oxygenase [Planctomycetes bacterium]|nr:2OG-Fe(II) oxygenase [Planctomycetota bacterium]
MAALSVAPEAFDAAALKRLRAAIVGSTHLKRDPLNRDFVGARGFAVVFRASERARVAREFPAFAAYLERALDPGCNAFYLNPLLIAGGGRVDPHVDRSLRAYWKEVPVPLRVSVLYVEVPPGMAGGELVLRRGKRELARHRPAAGELVVFDGDLDHAITRVELAAGSKAERISLVCEQYALEPDELERVPAFALESGAGSRYGR